MFQRQNLATSVVHTPDSTAGKTALSIQHNSAMCTNDSYPIDSLDRSGKGNALGDCRSSNPPSTQQLTRDRGPAPKRLKFTSLNKDKKATIVDQKTLKNFFQPKPGRAEANPSDIVEQIPALDYPAKLQDESSPARPNAGASHNQHATSESNPTLVRPHSNLASTEALATSASNVRDDFATRVEWTKLFSRRDPPRCEGHNEPCICLETKKKGINCGRKFYICSRYEISRII
jgi:AP endonuclease-2